MNDSLVLRINNALEHINANIRNVSSNKKWIKKMKITNESIDNKEMSEQINIVIDSLEKAMDIEDVRERGKVISKQYKIIRSMIKEKISRQLRELMEKLKEKNIENFSIIRSNGCELVLKGCFDLQFEHEIEVVFRDTKFIVCPGQMFNANNFRLATCDEVKEIACLTNGYEKQGYVICLEHTIWKEKYYIIANDVNTVWRNSKYYS